MSKPKQILQVHGIYFNFYLDKVNGELIPHVTARRNITPLQVIETFFTLNENKLYNIENKRWEGYSKQTGLVIYYYNYQGKEDRINIISALPPELVPDLMKRLKIKNWRPEND